MHVVPLRLTLTRYVMLPSLALWVLIVAIAAIPSQMAANWTTSGLPRRTEGK